MGTNSFDPHNSPIHSTTALWWVLLWDEYYHSLAVKWKLWWSLFINELDSPPHASLLGVLVSLSPWDSECSLDKKANCNSKTSSFPVSAPNSLEPTVNSVEFYLFEFSSKEYWGCLFMSLGTGILMSKWRSWNHGQSTVHPSYWKRD